MVAPRTTLRCLPVPSNLKDSEPNLLWLALASFLSTCRPQGRAAGNEECRVWLSGELPQRRIEDAVHKRRRFRRAVSLRQLDGFVQHDLWRNI